MVPRCRSRRAADVVSDRSSVPTDREGGRAATRSPLVAGCRSSNTGSGDCRALEAGGRPLATE